ncbi:MAG: glycosyltransferase family 2 protein [Parcubacteria group bacterium]
MKHISCIIPAFNEGGSIKNILETVANHPAIYETIVVNDCSSDNTGAIVSTFPNVKLITNQKNQGKSTSVCIGVKEAAGEFVLFLDADLIGLTSENISALVIPVIKGEADVTISLRKYKFWMFLGIDPLSGERVFSKNLIMDNFEKICALPSFGLEAFLNNYIIEKHYRIKIVPWENVISPYKHKKYGMWTGIKSDIGMIRDICSIASPAQLVYQIVRMLKLVK